MSLQKQLLQSCKVTFGRFVINVVWFSRVSPPSVEVHLIHRGEIFHPLRVTHFVDVMRVYKVHCIPVTVVSPVLPVLHDAVERHLLLTVFIEHVAQLITAGYEYCKQMVKVTVSILITFRISFPLGTSLF